MDGKEPIVIVFCASKDEFMKNKKHRVILFEIPDTDMEDVLEKIKNAKSGTPLNINFIKD